MTQFVLNEDQTMIRDMALAFGRDSLPVSRLRTSRDGGAMGEDEALNKDVAELGFLGVLVPEAYGGLGQGMMTMGQVMEAQGRTLAATPVLASGVLAASLIDGLGNEAQKSAWLSQLASGEVIGTLAVDETYHHAPLQIATEAERDGQGYTLNGAKRFVISGQMADVFIVAARSFGEPGQSHGISLFLVDKAAKGLSVQPLNTVDSHGAAHLVLEDVHVGEDGLLGPADTAWDGLELALDRGRAALSAELLGSATAAFEQTLDYLQTRKQFGQMIGSFQAIQHRAAKMFVELELTRSCVMAALSALDSGADRADRQVSLAKARAAETFHLISNEMVQLHGGIGMTDEHDAGFFLKRARVQEGLFGSASFHRDRYARLSGY